MTDKELIKKEIERRIEQCYRVLAQDLLPREVGETNVALQQYNELLQFIDSLPEEPTVKGITWEDVNTLDTLINQVRHEFSNGIGEKSFGLEVLERFQDYQDIIEEPVSGELEEEVHKHLLNMGATIEMYSGNVMGLDLCEDDYVDFARHFAEWQKQIDDKYICDLQWEAYLKGEQETKQQMMKDAIDALICGHPEKPWIDLIDESDVEVGTKVKLIIIKEK